MYQYVASLNQLSNVEVRFYTVPSIPNQYPYTRVNHAKYMVTDQAAYIGTNNWTGDYFVFTGGVSITSMADPIRAQLQAVFDRDWNSPYSSPVVRHPHTPLLALSRDHTLRHSGAWSLCTPRNAPLTAPAAEQHQQRAWRHHRAPRLPPHVTVSAACRISGLFFVCLRCSKRGLSLSASDLRRELLPIEQRIEHASFV